MSPLFRYLSSLPIPCNSPLINGPLLCFLWPSYCPLLRRHSRSGKVHGGVSKDSPEKVSGPTRSLLSVMSGNWCSGQETSQLTHPAIQLDIMRLLSNWRPGHPTGNNKQPSLCPRSGWWPTMVRAHAIDGKQRNKQRTADQRHLVQWLGGDQTRSGHTAQLEPSWPLVTVCLCSCRGTLQTLQLL